MKTRADKAGYVGHVHHQVGADMLCNLAKTFKIDNSGVRAGSGYYELRPFLPGYLLYMVVVDLLIVMPDSVGNNPEKPSGKTHRTSVGQMPPLA
jgi:hypothetical protein